MDTYGSISQRTAVWAAVRMLKHAEPVVILGRYGAVKEQPRNKAIKVKFRRPVPYSVSEDTLTEGVTPPEQQTTYEDVEVTLKQYGAYSKTTDVVADVAEDPHMEVMNMLAGEQAAATAELVLWSVLKGGTSVIYASKADTSRTDVNAAISLRAQRAAIKLLQAQKGKPVTKRVAPGVKFGVEPIPPAYIAFGHTDLAPDVEDLPRFIPVSKYAEDTGEPYEVGKVGNVRYILSPDLVPFLAAGSTTLNGMTSAAGVSVDVYPIIIIAQDAYATVPLKGKGSIIPSVINPGTISASDILGQNGYVGWKMWFAAVRLDESWMIRIEVGSTDIG